MAQRSMQAAHDAAHAVLKRIAASKALAPAGREAVLAWLAAALHACEPRTDGGEKAPLKPEYISRGCDDAFALGVAGVALAFVAPVLEKAEKAPVDTLPRVDAAAAGPLAHRLGSLVTGRRLALPAAAQHSTARESDSGVAAMDVDDDDADDAPPAADGAAAWVAASATLEAPANFMTECYFLAIRAMQTAVLPAAYRQQELVHDLSRHLSQFEELRSGRWPEAGSPAHRVLVAEVTAADCCSHALLLERFAVTATRLLALLLAATEAALAAAGDDAAAQADAAARIPEAAVRDAVNYATYVIHEGAPDLFAANRALGATMRVRRRSAHAAPTVRRPTAIWRNFSAICSVQCAAPAQALTAILRAPGVSSTMARAAIVDLLRAMLGHGGRRGASLAPPPTRPGARALTEAVYGAVSSAGVVPALMTAYADAAVVEGLDVDKFHFDKYSMRSSIDEVLQQLWRNSQCEADLLAMAAPGHPQCAPHFPPSSRHTPPPATPDGASVAIVAPDDSRSSVWPQVRDAHRLPQGAAQRPVLPHGRLLRPHRGHQRHQHRQGGRRGVGRALAARARHQALLPRRPGTPRLDFPLAVRLVSNPSVGGTAKRPLRPHARRAGHLNVFASSCIRSRRR